MTEYDQIGFLDYDVFFSNNLKLINLLYTSQSKALNCLKLTNLRLISITKTIVHVCVIVYIILC